MTRFARPAAPIAAAALLALAALITAAPHAAIAQDSLETAKKA